MAALANNNETDRDQPRDAAGTSLLLSVGVLMIAVLLRAWAPIDQNIGWLITVARHVLAGERLYVDIVETNPPMAVWIHLPAVLIERWTGLAAEPVFAAMTMLAALAVSLFMVRRLASAGLSRSHDLPLLLFILTVLPLSSYAEREHLALILTVPITALAILRAAGGRPGWFDILIAGTCAGLAAMIKPQFALPVIAVMSAQALWRRSFVALLAPEAVLAGGLTLVYLAGVYLALPAYVNEVMPVLFDLYRPLGDRYLVLTKATKTHEWLLALAAFLLSRRKLGLQADSAVLLAWSAGFFVAYVDQGRGWPYHALPMISGMMFVVARMLPQAWRSDASLTRMSAVAAVVVAAIPFAYGSYFPYPTADVTAAINRTVKSPTITSISFDLTPGHPITTDTHGHWIGTYSSRWITSMATRLSAATKDPALLDRYRHWMELDRKVANRDLAKRPDIVLVGVDRLDWKAWIAADPETTRLFADYRFLAAQPMTDEQKTRLEGVEAWIRADLIAPK
jgi:hypothetical protein